MSFNPRAFCETCKNFLLEDEIDEGATKCPNCDTKLIWPNGKTITEAEIERAARSLYPLFEISGNHVKNEYLRTAKAALEAARGDG